MTKVIQFPKAARPVAVETRPPVSDPAPSPVQGREGLGFWGGLRLGFWMLAVLVWPLLRWIVALDVFWQFCRMVYFWSTPGVYAGWEFLAHFAVLTALHYYVGIYRPKGA